MWDLGIGELMNDDWFLNIKAYEQTAYRLVEVKRMLTGLIQKLSADG